MNFDLAVHSLRGTLPNKAIELDWCGVLSKKDKSDIVQHGKLTEDLAKLKGEARSENNQRRAESRVKETQLHDALEAHDRLLTELENCKGGGWRKWKEKKKWRQKISTSKSELTCLRKAFVTDVDEEWLRRKSWSNRFRQSEIEIARDKVTRRLSKLREEIEYQLNLTWEAKIAQMLTEKEILETVRSKRRERQLIQNELERFRHEIRIRQIRDDAEATTRVELAQLDFKHTEALEKLEVEAAQMASILLEISGDANNEKNEQQRQMVELLKR